MFHRKLLCFLTGISLLLLVSCTKSVLSYPDAFISQGNFPYSLNDNSNRFDLDTDGDGIANAYDFFYNNRTLSVDGNGSQEAPFIIRNIYQMQAVAGFDHEGNSLAQSPYTNGAWLYGDDFSDQLSKHYKLGDRIDASITASWDHNGTTGEIFGVGFIPIGGCGLNLICDDSDDEAFNGNFTGDKYIIDQIFQKTIQSSFKSTGLFGEIGETSFVEHLGLNLVVIVGNSEAASSLTGINRGGIEGVSAWVDINGSNNAAGLVGVNFGSISDSYTRGTIIGGIDSAGLVAINRGEILSSNAITRTQGQGRAGGLVALASTSSIISNSYARGAVNATVQVGGLVGENAGIIFNSYSGSVVTGGLNVGGIVGLNVGKLRSVHSLGKVDAVTNLGGIAGYNSGSIRYSYSHAEIIGEDNIGGLIGVYNSSSPMDSSYFAGRIYKENNDGGGLIGLVTADFSLSAYWDLQSSQAPAAFGDNIRSSSSRVRGLSSDELKACSLNGELLRGGSRLLDCTGLFPAYLWGRVFYDGEEFSNYSMSYDFGTAGSYPTLSVISAEGEEFTLTENCAFGENLNNQCSHSIPVNQAVEGRIVGSILNAVSTDGNPSYSLANNYGLFNINETNGTIEMLRNATEDDVAVYQLTINADVAYDQRFLSRYNFFLVERYKIYYNISIESSNAGSTDYNYGDIDADGVVDIYDGYPSDPQRFIQGNGTAEEPFVIHNIYQLQAIAGYDHLGTLLEDSSSLSGGNLLFGDTRADQLTKHYFLTRDIDGTETASWGNGAGFIPIGECGNPDDCSLSFNGALDGDGHTITGISINSLRSQNGVGLFASLSEGAHIKDIGIEEAVVFGGSDGIGLLAGYAKSARVENVAVSGILTAINPISSSAGGLIGSADSSIINGSSATMNQIRGDTNIGGLMGKALATKIIRSYAEAQNIYGSINLGGLIGRSDQVNLSASYAAVDTISGTDNLGGLIGYSIGSSIIMSYASSLSGDSRLSAITGRDNLGGIIGLGQDTHIFSSYTIGKAIRGNDNLGGLIGIGPSSRIEFSYSAMGTISGNDNIGGLIGELTDNPPNEVINSYWDTTTSGLGARSGIAINLQGVAKTTRELQEQDDFTGTIYENWDGFWCVTPDNPNTYTANASSAFAVEDNLIWALGYAGQYPALVCVAGGLGIHQQRDIDRDGVPDNLDEDDDGDGINDSYDSCPVGRTGWISDPLSDIDGDGCRNDEDGDSDNDGVFDLDDACPLGATGWTSSFANDLDGDGCRNNEDEDIDNDGVPNSRDLCFWGQTGWISSVQTDPDFDGCNILEDWDNDNDGFLDDDDEFPFDPTEYQDSDGDGIGDNADVDADDDGIIDEQDVDMDGDGLIEVRDIGDLNNIRYSLDGTRLVRFSGDPGATIGCGGLNNINSCNGYELINDIDISGTANINWTPIGSCDSPDCSSVGFSGVFEGNNRLITNLRIDTLAGHTIGLFNRLAGTGVIRNLRMSNIYIRAPSATDNVGGLVGTAMPGSEISNIRISNAEIYATSARSVGSVVGYAGGTRITNIHGLTLVVIGREAVGALIGKAPDVVANSLTVSNAGIDAISRAGGIFGDATDATIISSSVQRLQVWEVNSYAGGIVGYGMGTDLRFSTLRDSNIVTDLWGGGIAGELAGGSVFAARVYDSSISVSNNYAGGIAAAASGASIQYSGVTGGSISGGSLVGGLVGRAFSANNQNSISITNSWVRVPRISSTGSYVGGLVGQGYRAKVLASYVEVESISGDNYVGGLIGYAPFSTIGASYLGSGTVGGANFVGGLLGYGASSTVTNSYSASVAVTGNEAGGLIGYAGISASNFANVISSYWDPSVIAAKSNIPQSAEGTPVDLDQLRTPTTFSSILSSWNLGYWCDSSNGDFTTNATSPIATAENIAWDLGDSTQLPSSNCDVSH